ncbi:hypothetical protein BaRGS_00018126 [Batillaria attramentaria]|uniref:C1q domain-containing protein n=1 Tax=Batillaria attramentaria TaxID=370345 RepID=A0ABD0KU46_9CAEN
MSRLLVTPSVILLVCFAVSWPLTSCTDDVDPLQVVTEQHSQKISQLESLIQQQANKMAAMDTLIQQQAATISGMQTSVQTLTSQMALQTPFVAFDVQYKDDPHNNVASHDILKFDAISMNIGNAYTASNGMFQAPVSGVYLFHVKLTPNPHGSIYAYLVKEGQNVDSVNAHDDTGNETGDTVRILQLDRGERVWLQKSSGVSSVRGWAHTKLAGVLLRAT